MPGPPQPRTRAPHLVMSNSNTWDSHHQQQHRDSAPALRAVRGHVPAGGRPGQWEQATYDGRVSGSCLLGNCAHLGNSPVCRMVEQGCRERGEVQSLLARVSPRAPGLGVAHSYDDGGGGGAPDRSFEISAYRARCRRCLAAVWLLLILAANVDTQLGKLFESPLHMYSNAEALMQLLRALCFVQSLSVGLSVCLPSSYNQSPIT